MVRAAVRGPAGGQLLATNGSAAAAASLPSSSWAPLGAAEAEVAMLVGAERAVAGLAAVGGERLPSYVARLMAEADGCEGGEARRVGPARFAALWRTSDWGGVDVVGDKSG